MRLFAPPCYCLLSRKTINIERVVGEKWSGSGDSDPFEALSDLLSFIPLVGHRNLPI